MGIEERMGRGASPHLGSTQAIGNLRFLNGMRKANGQRHGDFVQKRNPRRDGTTVLTGWPKNAAPAMSQPTFRL